MGEGTPSSPRSFSSVQCYWSPKIYFTGHFQDCEGQVPLSVSSLLSLGTSDDSICRSIFVPFCPILLLLFERWSYGEMDLSDEHNEKTCLKIALHMEY